MNKITFNNKFRKLIFLGLTVVMASSFTQKVYTIGISNKTRQNIAGVLSLAGEKLGYKRINLDPKLVALTSNELNQVNKTIDEILNKIIKPEYEEIEKAKAIYNFIVENLEYDYTTVNNSAYQALNERRTMCAGYSQLFFLMAKRCNLDVSYIIGEAGNELHIWNKIKINGIVYNIDATWADKKLENRYNYFMISNSVLSQTHTWK